jgi:hypothetical protein
MTDAELRAAYMAKAMGVAAPAPRGATYWRTASI